MHLHGSLHWFLRPARLLLRHVREEKIVRGKRIELFSPGCRPGAVPRRRAPQQFRRQDSNLHDGCQRPRSYRVRRLRIGRDGETRSLARARMKRRCHLGSSRWLQGSESNRVRFWHRVMSPTGTPLPDPCGALVPSRTAQSRFGGATLDPRARAVASREGVEPSQAGFVNLPPDPPAETWHPVSVSIRFLDFEGVAT